MVATYRFKNDKTTEFFYPPTSHETPVRLTDFARSHKGTNLTCVVQLLTAMTRKDI